MTKTGATFLTEQSFDIEKLTSVLKNTKIENNHDKKILESVIKSFSNNDHSLLTSQQVFFLKNHDEDQWADYLIFRYKFTNFPKNRTLSEFPNHLVIEPVSACNIRCVMCFQIDETFSKNQDYMGMMDIDLFKKIIDNAYEVGIKAVTLTGRGEPTLHPKIGEMLKYCSGKFFELKINTNATKLSEKLIHQILKNGITNMVFSVDSYTKDEYESIRVKGVFEEIVNNIKKFKEIKEKFYPNSRCETRISGVKVDKKQDPVKFKNFWQDYVDNVVMVEMENRWDTYHNPKEIMAPGACNYLWERMYIWYDGLCNPCDIDYKSELSAGTVKEQTIREIWHSKKYNDLRKIHLSGKRNKVYPCDRCPVDT